MTDSQLIISKSKLDKLNSLIGKRENKNHEYINSLLLASREKCKNWNNIQQDEVQKMEKKRLDEEKKELLEYYNKIIEKKEQQMKSILAEARDTFFKQNNEVKALHQAFVCADVLREQEAQRNFIKKLKEENRQQDSKYLNFLNKRWDEWKEQQDKLMQKRIQMTNEQSKFIQKQIEIKQNKTAEDFKERIEREKQERKSTLEELERLELLNREKKTKQQQNFKKYVESYLASKHQEFLENEALSKKEETLNDIYAVVQSQISTLRRNREREIEVQIAKRRSLVKRNFPDIVSVKIQKEKEIMKKSQEEKTKKETQRITEETIRKVKVKNELRKFHQEWIDRKKMLSAQKEQFKQREMEQRLVNIEDTHKLNESQRRTRLLKTFEVKEFNRRQQEEKHRMKLLEKLESDTFYGDNKTKDMKDADFKFFSTANELLEECIETNRPIQLILRVVNDYAARYNPNLDVLKTTFPKLFRKYEFGIKYYT